MSDTRKDEAHLRQALALARRLEHYTQQPLDSLATAMRTWPAEYRRIVYGIVQRKAARLEAEAAAEAEAGTPQDERKDLQR